MQRWDKTQSLLCLETSVLNLLNGFGGFTEEYWTCPLEVRRGGSQSVHTADRHSPLSPLTCAGMSDP